MGRSFNDVEGLSMAREGLSMRRDGHSMTWEGLSMARDSRSMTRNVRSLAPDGRSVVPDTHSISWDSLLKGTGRSLIHVTVVHWRRAVIQWHVPVFQWRVTVIQSRRMIMQEHGMIVRPRSWGSAALHPGFTLSPAPRARPSGGLLFPIENFNRRVAAIQVRGRCVQGEPPSKPADRDPAAKELWAQPA